MKKLIHNLVIVLLCMGTLLSCEKDVVVEGITASKEVRIAVVLPEKDREPIWNNALKWAAENIRKANIGVKVVYEWVDEPTADLTEVGLALSEREDIQSIIGCNVSANTQTLAFALARKSRISNLCSLSRHRRNCLESLDIEDSSGACVRLISHKVKSFYPVFPTRIPDSRKWLCWPLMIYTDRLL